MLRRSAVQRVERDLGLLQQKPADEHITDSEQERHRLQTDEVELSGVVRGVEQIPGQRGDHGLQILDRLSQQFPVVGEFGAGGVAVEEFLHLADDVAQRHTAITGDLAEEEVL